MNIKTAYDAYWFLMDHPKFRCREATMIGEVGIVKPPKAPTRGDRIRVVKDEMPWNARRQYYLHEMSLYREALSSNLAIFYAKVDDSKCVNSDKSKNKHIRCWLEFGTMKQAVSDGVLHIQHGHDPRLDCGGATFDEALMKLARLVKKHYGDYKPKG